MQVAGVITISLNEFVIIKLLAQWKPMIKGQPYEQADDSMCDFLLQF